MLRTINRVIDVILPVRDDAGPSGNLAQEWLQREKESYCMRCGVSMGFGGITDEGCSHCVNLKIRWHSVYRLGGYDTPLSDWIISYKFQKQWYWGKWFGRQLANIIRPQSNSMIVPVPLHWTRRITRGFDQAALISREIARQLNVKHAALLKRIKKTPPQTRMTSMHARQENVKDAFACKPVDLKGCTVYLVDDVKTTGATVDRCVRLLNKQGADAVHVVVAAVANSKAGGNIL